MSGTLKTTPLWQHVKLPRFGTVAKSRRFDVVVVGGGITGLTAAWLLKRAGKKVALLERDRLCSVDTGHTTAHLTAVTDLRLGQMSKNFGNDATRLVWQAGCSAIGTIERIVQTLGIDCSLRRVPNYLHGSLDSKKDESRDLKKEANLARELGIEAVFQSEVPYFGKPGVRYANQAKFHPLKYLAAVAEAIPGDGSAIFEGAEVEEVSDDPLAAVVGGKKIECDYVVIATHVPLTGKTGLVNATLFQSKLAPYTSYVVGGPLPKGLVPEASYYDTTDPYYYLRIETGKKHDYLIFGGKDHKTGQESDTEGRFADLRARLYQLIPEASLDCQWSGQVIETNDGLPYIGETAQRQFAATGFGGNGMTFGTLAATMACDAVLGRENPWQELFSVNRKKIRGGAWDYLKENFDYPYYLVRDLVAKADGTSTRDVQRGQGQILQIDGQRVACSRDESGKLTSVSAVCTHMGCLVQWNGAEQTWDCPCHGSRFHPSGEVLAGPAESPLEPVGKPAQKAKAAGPKKSSKAAAANGQKKKPPRPGSAGRKSDRPAAARRSR